MTDYLSKFRTVRQMYTWNGWDIYWYSDEGRCELFDPHGDFVMGEEDLPGVITGISACERLAAEAVRRDAEETR
jgi:hypothetical protein